MVGVILDTRRGQKVEWDTDKQETVAAAEAIFAEARAEGAMAIAVAGDKTEQIRTFDPNAQSIELLNPLAGG